MQIGRGNQSFISRLFALLTQPGAAILWFVAVAISFAVAFNSLSSERKFDTSILALLPDNSDAQNAAERVAKENLTSFAGQRLLFLVHATDKTTSLTAAEVFVQALQRSDAFLSVDGNISTEHLNEWESFYFPHRYSLLTDKARDALTKSPSSDPTHKKSHPLVTQAVARLYSPLASSVAPQIIEDPLQLFFDWQLTAQPKIAFSLQNGWMTREVDGRIYRLVSAELTESPYSMSYQARVKQAIQEGVDDIPVGAEILSSGLLIHAAYGAEQAKQEVSTIGIGSFAGIAFLLLFVFRRVRFLLIAFLPIVVGCLFAFAICSVVFKQLHLITLAFGAGLVGVAIDYSLHYLCAEREPGRDAKSATIALIFPGLLLGLVSSVLAYAAQGIAPFPGLRQMAVFSACGLLGAWLTVVCWVPRLPIPPCRSEEARNMPQAVVKSIDFILLHWPTTASKLFCALLVVLIGIMLLLLTFLKTDDDIRRLQTSPQWLLAEEAKVQSLLNSVSGGQYFVLSAADPQQLLIMAETLAPRLTNMVKEGELSDYFSIANNVPSLQRQNSNRELLREAVYAQDGLAVDLATQIGTPGVAQGMIDAFTQNQIPPLTLADWLDSPLSELQSYLWLGDLEGQVHMLVALAGIRNENTLLRLDALAAAESGIEFVDNAADITAVLRHHRVQLQRWLVVAYVAVLVLLAWRYGMSAWRVIAAPALASILALTLFSVFGLSVNIFNLLALLLVLGIGLDASIFLRESQRSSYAWIAVTLSALTTLMAFGLLALSQTPVLHQFGITVLLGICGVWLLTPCFVIKNEVV